jgi:hypothetical protein
VQKLMPAPNGAPGAQAGFGPAPTPQAGFGPAPPAGAVPVPPPPTPPHVLPNSAGPFPSAATPQPAPAAPAIPPGLPEAGAIPGAAGASSPVSAEELLARRRARRAQQTQ